MKIVELDVRILNAANDGPAYWVSNFIVPRANELLVRIRTRDGVEGFGLATSYSSAEPMIQAFKSGIADLVLGEDASAPERLYEKLFGLTSQRVAYEKGYMALYRLFGGYRDTVPYYVTCAYYRDGKTIPEIKDELQQLTSKGHRAFKAKVGGLPLKEDIARIEAIREVIGADDDLMIDVNRGWSLQTAIEGARLLEPLNVRWLEEPVRWNDDHRELRLLAQQTKIPLSGGESELTMFRCRDPIEDHAIQILQADSTMSGGYTALKKEKTCCALWTQSGPPRAASRLRPPCTSRRIVARRTHSGIVRRGSRSLTGRAVRKSAEDWKGGAHNCSDCARSPNADHRAWPRPS